VRLLLVPHARTRVGVGVHAFCMQGVEWFKFVLVGKLSCMFYKTLIQSGIIKKKIGWLLLN
jgi:hypothetical protein